MPQYLISFNDEWVPAQTDDQLVGKGAASRAVVAEMQQAGVLLFTHGGLDATTALCSVTLRDGEPLFTDGPYVETKEHLGGFCAIEVDDDETARHWAGRLAAVLDWPQEVHRFEGRGMSSVPGVPGVSRHGRGAGE